MPHTVVENSANYPIDWTSIVFTHPDILPEGPEAEAALLCRALHTGAADIIHLRKPEVSREYVNRLLRALSPEARARVMLHDHYDLAEKHGLRGIQLNSRHEPPHDIAGKCSFSCHSLEEVAERAPHVDYLTLSPIFDSISKPGYESNFTPESLSGKLPRGKVMALGGVTPRELPRLRRAGFAGSALLGWVWNNFSDERLKILAFRLRLLRAFPLLLITDAPGVEETVRQAVAAYKGGCRWAQIRMKDASTGQRVQAAREVMRLCPEMLVCIDDDCEAVALSGAHGVHLGKTDIATSEARKILGPAPIVGRTANTFEDICEISGTDGTDYIGLGPLRHTLTKKNLSPTLGIEGYRQILESMRQAGIHLPVVAIGGILPSDIASLVAAGVDSVAVSGAINKAAAPEQAAQEFITQLKKNINENHG